MYVRMKNLIGGARVCVLSRCKLRMCPSVCRNHYNAQRLKSCVQRYSSGQNTVRVGCASGFWGDTATSGNQLKIKTHPKNTTKPFASYISQCTSVLNVTGSF